MRNNNGMKSIREIYKIGCGPSSTHTIGPERASLLFLSKNRDADRFKVILYGSLALTGKGHRTDYVIEKTFSPYKTEIVFDGEKTDIPHPNTMEFFAYKGDRELSRLCILSTGGGMIEVYGESGEEYNADEKLDNVYELSTLKDIREKCESESISFWEYVERCEGKDIWAYLQTVWQTMKDSISRGLCAGGVLFGGLDVQKKAKYLYSNMHIDESDETREMRLVCSYAYAVSEENASGEKIVTAPTCGSAGVLPSILLYMQESKRFSDKQILKALATAGLIGNIIKTNASISGAECGCQAEIGSACSMTAAALAQLFELDYGKIEYAAEIAMEHHLGLTCDPVCGLVQIPCIERNAVAALRAIDAFKLSSFLSNTRKISFDLVVRTMYETGKDLSRDYRETSVGGLAKLYVRCRSARKGFDASDTRLEQN